MRIVKDRRDFDRIFHEGYRGGSHLSRVIWAPSREAEGRVAFVAARRIGNAVERNRSKRVLRACAAEAGFPRSGKDVVIMATPHTKSAAHADVVRSLRLSMQRADDAARKAGA